MYYTIYKTYNLINGKEYIGKHQTKNINDEYIGSGKYLKRAITKYGKENFIKDIIYVFNTELEMNFKEKELVNKEYIDFKLSYNLCPGGKGGFGYINQTIDFTARNRKISNKRSYKEPKLLEFLQSEKNKKQKSEFFKKLHREGILFIPNWTNRKHKEESKIKIGKANSIHQQGEKNSQYGTCWITNGTENKKIKKEELALYINQGYYKGRI